MAQASQGVTDGVIRDNPGEDKLNAIYGARLEGNRGFEVEPYLIQGSVRH